MASYSDSDELPLGVQISLTLWDYLRAKRRGLKTSLQDEFNMVRKGDKYTVQEELR